MLQAQHKTRRIKHLAHSDRDKCLRAVRCTRVLLCARISPAPEIGVRDLFHIRFVTPALLCSFTRGRRRLHMDIYKCMCVVACGPLSSVSFSFFAKQVTHCHRRECFFSGTLIIMCSCVCCVFVYIGLLSLCLSAFDSPLLMCFSLCALLVCACVCATTKYTKTHMRHKRTRTLTTIIKANTFSAVQVLFLRSERGSFYILQITAVSTKPRYF